jgi:archaellin
MRTYRFQFTVECASQGDADLAQVENLIDLAMQELVYDDRFVTALDEREAVTIQVIPQSGVDIGK